MSRLALTGTVFLILALPAAPVRAETPLYEESPYDQVTLDAAHGGDVLKIKPLDEKSLFGGRQPLKKLPQGRLEVRLLDSPEKKYEVAGGWRSVAKFEFFEELVLAKAAELVAAGRFDDAYDYYLYVERNWPDWPGARQATEDFLLQEAEQSRQRGQYDGALALMRELGSRNPRRPDLEERIGQATEDLIRGYVKKQNYAAVRALVRGLAADYPDHPVVVRWRQRLIGQATPLRAAARAAADAGQWDKASEQIREVAALWPNLPGARELARNVYQNYSRVVVGVSAMSDNPLPNRPDWTARRDSRLLYRTLTEFLGASSEGGKYDCPVGMISSGNLGRRLTFQLKPGVGWAKGNATLTGIDVSRRLLAMTDPADASYRADWSDLMAAVSVRGVYTVEVELRRPHVRPEALLQIPLLPHTMPPLAADEPPPVNGPFVVQSRSADEVVYAANRHYFAAKPSQPKQLVERRYPTISKAIKALRRGEIHMVDRINPWDAAALRDDTHVLVQPYALPLVHCLIPNLRRPLMRDRTFRRGLAYGIHREAILEQMLGGVDLPGCAVTSSPFLMGVDAGDPMGYASDSLIKPRPFNPWLARLLGTIALQAYADAHKNDPKPPPAKHVLVLAHPADEVATAACKSILKQLDLLKLNVSIELRPIDGPMPSRVPDDVDLLYVELPAWEPLVDAHRLLGAEGMTGSCSPYMTLALRQLDEAVDWSQVRDRLHRIHCISYDDVAILPLWQLVEQFAYHESLRGVAASPVSLFQNIEQWRAPFPYPTE
jgi:tetratricopeptide (TPR) repeat protein